MADIATVWDPLNARGDWVIDPPGLQQGSDLFTAVIISLFTDATAVAADVIPDGTNDPRGWWGDLGQDRPIGSKLWLLDRAKLTPQLASQAKDYATDALKWLIDDGVAASVTVTTQITPPAMLAMQVVIAQPSGPPTVFNFQRVWEGVS